ncbi:hypothetical protein MMC25_001037 [Agyrium rufum]|nr:hypothetical protein [Agyrium rufum]
MVDMVDSSTTDHHGRDKEVSSINYGDERDEENRSSLSSDNAPIGVKNLEAITLTWTKCIFTLAFCTSLEGQTTVNLTVYATSAFAEHSLVSTVYVVQGVVNAVWKLVMAKGANAFGRLEAFTLSVFLYMIGYIQMAGSNNVKTFASAQIFYSAGSTGLQILQQIFIADTSNLLNRALFSSLPDIPFLITTWVGGPIASNLLSHTTWRWGYGLWAIVLPVAFLPLALALLLNFRKAKKLNLAPPNPWLHMSPVQVVRAIWFQLDIFGLLLFAAAIALILLPLTLAASAKGGWHNASMIAMEVIGCVLLPVFIGWETSHKLAPNPILSLRLLTNRTVLAGCGIGFFYFAVFYTSVQPYFYSYLQVVQFESVTAASHVTLTFSFTSTVAAICTSLFIKYTKHYKYYVTAGALIYLMGIGLMIRYRVQGSSIGQIVGTQIAVGIGGGMLNVPAQLGVQASVSHADVAAVTAIFLTIVEIGGAVGSAISGAVWSSNLPKKLAAYLPPDSPSTALEIFGNLTLAESFPASSAERIAINRSYQETMNILLIIAVCLAIPLIPLSLIMSDYKLDTIDQHVRGRVVGGNHGNDSEVQEPQDQLETQKSKKSGIRRFL